MKYAMQWLKDNHGVEFKGDTPVDAPAPKAKYKTADERMAELYGPKVTVPQEAEPDMATRLNQRLAQAHSEAEAIRNPVILPEYTSKEIQDNKNRDFATQEALREAARIKAGPEYSTAVKYDANGWPIVDRNAAAQERLAYLEESARRANDIRRGPDTSREQDLADYTQYQAGHPAALAQALALQQRPWLTDEVAPLREPVREGNRYDIERGGNRVGREPFINFSRPSPIDPILNIGNLLNGLGKWNDRTDAERARRELIRARSMQPFK